jgi:hypothetical protein
MRVIVVFRKARFSHPDGDRETQRRRNAIPKPNVGDQHAILLDGAE